tara:strand:- start:633 stop:782 length:150 start_codon:yes stop_codon:yes gene_type:complete
MKKATDPSKNKDLIEYPENNKKKKEDKEYLLWLKTNNPSIYHMIYGGRK